MKSLTLRWQSIMGHSDKKRPKWAQIPDTTKTPKTASDTDWRKSSVLWSFSIFDAYDWRNDHEREFHEAFCDVLCHLKSCEGRTWAEIEANRKRDHAIPISGIIPESRRRLEQLHLEDVDELWRLRFEGRMRIWGIRDRRMLKVIWWDPHHNVCPSELKNT